jgi:hypothetical protein
VNDRDCGRPHVRTFIDRRCPLGAIVTWIYAAGFGVPWSAQHVLWAGRFGGCSAHVSLATTWEEFEFTQGRDIWTYAQEMMLAVEQFIDEVLSAFEDHVPERFRS